MLTAKQEKFVIELSKGKTQSEAYKLSYNASKMKETTICRKANEELEKPHVRARYEELLGKIRKKAEDKAIFTVEGLLEELKELIDRNKGDDDRTALDGLKTAMKHMGMFIDKVEHSGEIKQQVQIIDDI